MNEFFPLLLLVQVESVVKPEIGLDHWLGLDKQKLNYFIFSWRTSAWLELSLFPRRPTAMRLSPCGTAPLTSSSAPQSIPPLLICGELAAFSTRWPRADLSSLDQLWRMSFISSSRWAEFSDKISKYNSSRKYRTTRCFFRALKFTSKFCKMSHVWVCWSRYLQF